MNTKKHSSRAFTWLILLVITLAILLSGCDNSTDQTSYSSPAPPDTSLSTSIGEDSAVSSSHITNDENLTDVVIINKTMGEETTITVEQQKYIADEVNSIIRKFESGEYPLLPAEATDYAPFVQSWPPDLLFPDSVTASDIKYSDYDTLYGPVGTIYFQNYMMNVALAGGEKDKNAENFWGVSDLYFEESRK